MSDVDISRVMRALSDLSTFETLSDTKYELWKRTTAQLLRSLPAHFEQFNEVLVRHSPYDSDDFPEALRVDLDVVLEGARSEWQQDEITKRQAKRAATVPGSKPVNASSALCRICDRFHTVVVSLRRRRGDRSPLTISDEYDVQYLMNAVLRLNFDDVRPEEWTPSYGGSASRQDFLLHKEEIVIEVKMMRESMSRRDLGDQLLVDIAKYGQHPRCKRLLCFVYDPEHLLTNPAEIERDLTKTHNELPVEVIVRPKG